MVRVDDANSACSSLKLVEIDDREARIRSLIRPMPTFNATRSAGRGEAVDADQPEAVDIELAGEVDARVREVGRNHERDADIEVGDLEADRCVVQFRGLVGIDDAVADLNRQSLATADCPERRPRHFVVAVEVGPVGTVRADERGDVGGADRHRHDFLGAAVAQRHRMRRPELERDAAGQEDRVEEIELEESLGADQS